jgi:hypothetical protein
VAWRTLPPVATFWMSLVEPEALFGAKDTPMSNPPKFGEV